MDRRFWDLEIGSQDHLTLGGCDLVELAHTYGTPLHVVDETRLRRNVEDFRRAFAGRSPGAEIFYSYKTNCVPGVLSLLHEQGCGAEAASPYECWLAAALGVPPSSVIYNGISDGSLTPPDWYGWLHHTSDVPPTQERYVKHEWEKPYVPNMTGTPLAYRPPGSTLAAAARPPATGDYEAWSPE